ncbi:MAG: hypothetical protein QF570_06370 [Myxococcota bacterium]|jgi:MFS family permease|nr:hypothetical protein [Myxococcota bacterium]
MAAPNARGQAPSELEAACGDRDRGLSLRGRLPDGAAIGVLSTAFIIANSATNFAWGLMADRTGCRLVRPVAGWELHPLRIAAFPRRTESSGPPGGVIAVLLSKAWLFGIAIAFQLTAMAIVVVYLDEPRDRV